MIVVEVFVLMNDKWLVALVLEFYYDSNEDGSNIFDCGVTVIASMAQVESFKD